MPSKGAFIRPVINDVRKPASGSDLPFQSFDANLSSIPLNRTFSSDNPKRAVDRINAVKNQGGMDLDAILNGLNRQDRQEAPIRKDDLRRRRSNSIGAVADRQALNPFRSKAKPRTRVDLTANNDWRYESPNRRRSSSQGKNLLGVMAAGVKYLFGVREPDDFA